MPLYVPATTGSFVPTPSSGSTQSSLGTLIPSGVTFSVNSNIAYAFVLPIDLEGFLEITDGYIVEV